jgi:hypothetical protein
MHHLELRLDGHCLFYNSFPSLLHSQRDFPLPTLLPPGNLKMHQKIGYVRRIHSTDPGSLTDIRRLHLKAAQPSVKPQPLHVLLPL